MKSNRNLLLFVLIISIVSFACGGTLPGTTDVTQETTTEVPVESATEAPIIHTIIPSAAATNLGNASDNEETQSFEDRDVNFGDDFVNNRFERPFTTEMADYLPDIDIVKFSIGEDDNFFYVSLTLGGLAAGQQLPSGHYAVEVDGDVDGRGEFIVLVSPAYTEEWSVNGVQIYIDENSDIGGENYLISDNSYNGNGYEKLVFDSGQGATPDLGWSRFVPGTSPVIEIAFSKQIFPSTPKFMWSVWANASPFSLTSFNLHDTTTEETAGSPDKENTYYPIKGLAAIDNSCRVPVGFTATGAEPLGCPVAGVEPVPGDPYTPPLSFCDLYPILCNIQSLPPIYPVP